jgi:hypothetical protein
MPLAMLLAARHPLRPMEDHAICRFSKPCDWMDEAIVPGVEAALASRGGLRARIPTDGKLRVGA